MLENVTLSHTPKQRAGFLQLLSNAIHGLFLQQSKALNPQSINLYSVL